MIEDHKTRTIQYAYERFIELSCDSYKRMLRADKVPDDVREHYDKMWTWLMEFGAEGFFLEATEAPDDEIEYEVANFFIWSYERDGWTTFRPYWQVLRVTWRNYKAMGLDMLFDSTEGYSVQKK